MAHFAIFPKAVIEYESTDFIYIVLHFILLIFYIYFLFGG